MLRPLNPGCAAVDRRDRSERRHRPDPRRRQRGVTPHYAITPLDGIRERAEGNVEFERGCVITKNTPVLDDRHLRATIEYFGNRDFEGRPIITETLRRAHQVWMGKARTEIEPGEFTVRVRGTFTPQDTGTHRLTLTSAGLSRLMLDGEVVVDNWTEQTRGSSSPAPAAPKLAPTWSWRRARLRLRRRVPTPTAFDHGRLHHRLPPTGARRLDGASRSIGGPLRCSGRGGRQHRRMGDRRY